VLRPAIGAAVLLALNASHAGAVSSSSTPSSKTQTVAPGKAIATYCPRVLHRATRLIIVTVPNMSSVKATLHTFERRTPADAAWLRAGPPESAVVGAGGVAWSEDYGYLAKKNEPVKLEGDKRTPAGIFRVAGPFGFEASKLAGYTRLAKDNSFCVADPASQFYGKIVGKGVAKYVKASENMSAETGLKRGMIVDYPARRGAKAGSCVFIQIWDGEANGTNARIGMPEERLTVLQKWSAKGFTAIAIVSEDAANRFKGCLPINSAASKYEQAAGVPEPNPRRRVQSAPKEQRADLGR